jgi:hypothetical protein
MKYIDQSNLTNACKSCPSLPVYVADLAGEDVSGMKEDLKIEGNEYTYMLSKAFMFKIHESLS